MDDDSLIPDSFNYISSSWWDSPDMEDDAYKCSLDTLNDDTVDVPNELLAEQSIEVENEDINLEINVVDNTTKQEDIIEVDTERIIDTDQNGMEEDAPRMTYECGQCSCSYASRAARKMHVRSQHPKDMRIKDEKKKYKAKSSVTKRYPCPSCSYASRRRDKIDKHIEKHVMLDGVHPCGKKRHKPEALPQRHRYNAEEYKCPHCPYTCTVYQALTNHQKVHLEGVEVFTVKLSCKICGEDQLTEAEVQKHMKTHKRGDHFQCDLCPFTSVQLKKLIQHRRVHTREKPHLCMHCSFSSARRDNLRDHVRRIHEKQNMYMDTFNPKEK